MKIYVSRWMHWSLKLRSNSPGILSDPSLRLTFERKTVGVLLFDILTNYQVSAKQPLTIKCKTATWARSKSFGVWAL